MAICFIGTIEESIYYSDTVDTETVSECRRRIIYEVFLVDNKERSKIYNKYFMIVS